MLERKQKAAKIKFEKLMNAHRMLGLDQAVPDEEHPTSSEQTSSDEAMLHEGSIATDRADILGSVRSEKSQKLISTGNKQRRKSSDSSSSTSSQGSFDSFDGGLHSSRHQ